MDDMEVASMKRALQQIMAICKDYDGKMMKDSMEPEPGTEPGEMTSEEMPTEGEEPGDKEKLLALKKNGG